MPTLAIRDDLPFDMNVLYMWTVMVYPTSPVERDLMFAVHMARAVKAMAEAGAPAEIVKDWAQAFVRSGGGYRILAELSEVERLDRHEGYAIQRGLIAGELLWYIVRLEHSGYEGSVNKAVYLLEQILQKAKAQGNYHGPCNPASIRAAWSSHRSVAHFWAAYHMARHIIAARPGFKKRGGFQSSDGWMYMGRWLAKRFPDFLVLADAFREFGLCHRGPRQRAPLLSVNDTCFVGGHKDISCPVPCTYPPSLTTQSPLLTSQYPPVD
jgi:hypothetical protein